MFDFAQSQRYIINKMKLNKTFKVLLYGFPVSNVISLTAQFEL